MPQSFCGGCFDGCFSFLKGPAASYAKYPRQYAARRGTPPCIDGDIYKDAWNAVPWSEPFVEIRGDNAPAGTGPRTIEETRMKMLWDDEFLYVAAIIDIAAGDELIAKFTERNSPIFHLDSDFEVFVDAEGTCHNYKEIEMNAINTVWNIKMPKPFGDKGDEHSGRVAKEGESRYWEVQKQRTAARILKGSLNDTSQPSQWCCEIALSYSDNLEPGRFWHSFASPVLGNFWHINFSRVEKNGKVNWVWNPQVVWSPSKTAYEGKVNMHLPDAWGYVVFADERGCLPDGSPAETWRDPSFAARHAATCVYYAARHFLGRNKRQAKDIDELRASGLLAGAPVPECCTDDSDEYMQIDPDAVLLLSDLSKGFMVKGRSNGWNVIVQQDRYTKLAPC